MYRVVIEYANDASVRNFPGIGSIVSLLFGARIINWYASQFR